ncbi:Ger(x)C family spore germination protein [Paenibacillus oryzisoli]|uniref:Ger(x)C family spore germination protein n=1 Tax=Paenibacillus oryzisoli TaxID=1850517 RepID=UPI003D281F5F
MIRKIGLILLMLFLSGCWDRVEIDQRGFVTGVAVDMGNVTEKQDQEAPKSVPTYRSTYQIIVPAGLKQSGSSKEVSTASTGGTYFNISAFGNSMPAISSKIAAETSRSPYFEHLKIIAISSDLAKGSNNIADIMDYFLRDNEIRRGVKILITDGPAKEVLSVDSLNEKYPIAYIESTINNIKNNNAMVPATRIGDLHEQLLKNNAYVVQKIKSSHGKMSLTGAAVIDNKNRFVGFLSDEETQGLNLLKGDVKGGTLEVKLDGQLLDFGFDNEHSRITAVLEGNEIQKFMIAITAEGYIGKTAEQLDLTKLNNITMLQKAIEEQIVHVCEATIHTLQSRYQKDVIGLGEYLNQNHYRLWTALEADWNSGEHRFANIPIDVHASVDIRRIGDINRSE